MFFIMGTTIVTVVVNLNAAVGFFTVLFHVSQTPRALKTQPPQLYCTCFLRKHSI